MIAIGELAIDVAARGVHVDGVPVALTNVEFDVLSALARRRGASVSHVWLLEQITDTEGHPGTQALDVSVAQLKVKLGRAGSRIKPVWGVGYRLDA